MANWWIGGVAGAAALVAWPAPDMRAPEITGRTVLPPSEIGLPGEGELCRVPHFPEIWHERRSRFARTAPDDRGKIVFFGDSIVQRWGDGFHGHFPGIQTVNRGINGDTTRGMLLRFQEDVLDLAPRAVVFLGGINDVATSTEIDAIARNIRKMLDLCRQHDPDLPVFVCDVFPCTASLDRPPQRIRALNAAVHEVVADFPMVTAIDTFSPFAGEDGESNSIDFCDRLHLSERGFEKWAGILYPEFVSRHLYGEEEGSQFFASPLDGYHPGGS